MAEPDAKMTYTELYAHVFSSDLKYSERVVSSIETILSSVESIIEVSLRVEGLLSEEIIRSYLRRIGSIKVHINKLKNRINSIRTTQSVVEIDQAYETLIIGLHADGIMSPTGKKCLLCNAIQSDLDKYIENLQNFNDNKDYQALKGLTAFLSKYFGENLINPSLLKNIEEVEGLEFPGLEKRDRSRDTDGLNFNSNAQSLTPLGNDELAPIRQRLVGQIASRGLSLHQAQISQQALRAIEDKLRAEFDQKLDVQIGQRLDERIAGWQGTSLGASVKEHVQHEVDQFSQRFQDKIAAAEAIGRKVDQGLASFEKQAESARQSVQELRGEADAQVAQKDLSEATRHWEARHWIATVEAIVF